MLRWFAVYMAGVALALALPIWLPPGFAGVGVALAALGAYRFGSEGEGKLD